MVVRHCGFTAVVKVSAEVNWEGSPIPQDIDIEDQPEGGANALNVNRSISCILSILVVYKYVTSQQLNFWDLSYFYNYKFYVCIYKWLLIFLSLL